MEGVPKDERENTILFTNYAYTFSHSLDPLQTSKIQYGFDRP